MKGLVVIIKNKRKVILHTRLQRFSTEEDKNKFLAAILKAFDNKGYIIKQYIVSDEPKEALNKPKRGKRYCPYCRQEVKLKKGEFGSKVCPICGISEQEFYFKKYNNFK